MSARRRGLTMIELLISIGILFMLIAMMATIYTRSSNVAITSLALLQLYHKQEALDRALETDLEALLPHAALVVEPGSTLTMMTARRRDPTQDGHLFTLDPWPGYELEWVRYEWDPVTGMLLRGDSRSPPSRDSQQVDGWSLRNDIASMGAHPTAQRSARYLIGAGAVDPTPGLNVPPGGRETVFEGVDGVENQERHRNFPDRRFVGPDAERQLRITGILGDVRPVAGVHAVVNPDGRSVNKDWANLVGEPPSGDEHYPTQVAVLAERVELFELRLYRRDGTAIGDDPAKDDADTLEDGTASIDVRGLRLDHRQDPTLDTRPERAVIRYLLHDVPPRDVGSDGVTPLIEELRLQVLGDAALSDPDPVVEGENRRRALRDAIVEWKRHAIIVTKSVRLPL